MDLQPQGPRAGEVDQHTSIVHEKFKNLITPNGSDVGGALGATETQRLQDISLSSERRYRQKDLKLEEANCTMIEI